MKICYIVKWYPRLSQTCVLNELLELERQGADLVVVALKAPHDETAPAACRALRAPVYYLPDVASLLPEAFAVRERVGTAVSSRLPGPDAARSALAHRDYTTELQAAAIAPFIAHLGVEHLHAHFATWPATFAAALSRITGIPYSFTAHARDIYHACVDRAALAAKIAQAQFVVTVSDDNKRYLDDLLRDEGPAGRIIRLYNGIDLAQLLPVEEDRDPGLIVGVGRLVAKKGFDHLIRACRHLAHRGNDVRCIIAGEGPERAPLTELIARSGLAGRVSLVGAQPHEAIQRLMRRATLFALPCVVDENGDRDALPTVLLEAMALGTPVISTRVGGIPEIIDHGWTGLLVEPQDAMGLALALESLLTSAAGRGVIREAALARVRNQFSLADNVRTLHGLFASGGVTA